MLESVESCCINHGKFSEDTACSNSHGLAYIHGSHVQFFCASFAITRACSLLIRLFTCNALMSAYLVMC